jgi:hypothetical protein
MTGHLKSKSWADRSVKSQQKTFETAKAGNASKLLNFENRQHYRENDLSWNLRVRFNKA